MPISSAGGEASADKSAGRKDGWEALVTIFTALYA
jgi:hypothetical protein